MCPVLRDESEVMLKDLRFALEKERVAEHDRLEAKKRQDIERVKAELEEELQADKRRLQVEREEKLNALKQEVSERGFCSPDCVQLIFDFSFV